MRQPIRLLGDELRDVIGRGLQVECAVAIVLAPWGDGCEWWVESCTEPDLDGLPRVLLHGPAVWRQQTEGATPGVRVLASDVGACPECASLITWLALTDAASGEGRVIGPLCDCGGAWTVQGVAPWGHCSRVVYQGGSGQEAELSLAEALERPGDQ